MRKLILMLAAASMALAAPASAEKKLCKLKLTMPKIKGMNLMDMGDMGCNVSTEAFGFVIGPAADYNPSNLDDAKKEAVETYDGDQLKPMELPNGFLLGYHNKTEFGDNWVVSGFLSVGGKKYTISSMVTTPEQQSAVMEALKTVH